MILQVIRNQSISVGERVTTVSWSILHALCLCHTSAQSTATHPRDNDTGFRGLAIIMDMLAISFLYCERRVAINGQRICWSLCAAGDQV